MAADSRCLFLRPASAALADRQGRGRYQYRRCGAAGSEHRPGPIRSDQADADAEPQSEGGEDGALAGLLDHFPRRLQAFLHRFEGNLLKSISGIANAPDR